MADLNLEVTQGASVDWTIQVITEHDDGTTSYPDYSAALIEAAIRPTIKDADSSATPIYLFSSASGTASGDDEGNIRLFTDDHDDETGTGNPAWQDATFDIKITTGDDVDVIPELPYEGKVVFTRRRT